MRSYRSLGIALFLLCSSFVALSQDSLSVEDFRMKIHKSVIKLSPLHLLNFYPSIQFAYERSITYRTSIQIDLGYVFSNKTDNPRFEHQLGAKTKIEYRYYLSNSTKNQRLNGGYISGEPYFNGVNFNRTEYLIGCFDASCQQQFQQNLKYFVQYREQGISFKYGEVFDWKGRFIFDANIGLTYRMVRYRYKGRPDYLTPFDDLNGFWPVPNERNRETFSPAIGLRLGYIITK